MSVVSLHGPRRLLDVFTAFCARASRAHRQADRRFHEHDHEVMSDHLPKSWKLWWLTTVIEYIGCVVGVTDVTAAISCYGRHNCADFPNVQRAPDPFVGRRG